MFIVRWEGGAPADKEEWNEVMREVFMGASGSYRVVFRRGRRGWLFDLDCRESLGTPTDDMVANSPDSIRFTLHKSLVGRGKPLDPDWRAED